jgi:hypothetical protein
MTYETSKVLLSQIIAQMDCEVKFLLNFVYDSPILLTLRKYSDIIGIITLRSV